MTQCPICGQDLQANDEYRLTWYEPRKWWVFYHDRDGRLFCAQADVHGTIAKMFNARNPKGPQ